MNFPRINYVIATWDGKYWSEVVVGQRTVLDIIGNPKGNEVLATHLRHLSKIKHHLAQITIMKPTPHDKLKYEDYYKKAEQVIIECQFSCPIKIIETDKYLLYSYGQWWHAYELFKNEFDYYIFMEDDTVAAIPYFDTILMTLFQQRIPNQLGYLCSKVFPFAIEFTPEDYQKYDRRLETLAHAAISTGITNLKTLQTLFQKYDVYARLQDFMVRELKIERHPFNFGNMKQMNFSLMFTHSGCTHLCDYADIFLSPFWARESLEQKQHIYIEYSTTKHPFAVPLLMPVTMCCDESLQKFRLLDKLGALPLEIARTRIRFLTNNCEIQYLDLSNECISNELLKELTSNCSIQRLNLVGNNVTF